MAGVEIVWEFVYRREIRRVVDSAMMDDPQQRICERGRAHSRLLPAKKHRLATARAVLLHQDYLAASTSEQISLMIGSQSASADIVECIATSKMVIMVERFRALHLLGWTFERGLK